MFSGCLFAELIADTSVISRVWMNTLDVDGLPLGECFDFAG